RSDTFSWSALVEDSSKSIPGLSGRSTPSAACSSICARRSFRKARGAVALLVPFSWYLSLGTWYLLRGGDLAGHLGELYHPLRVGPPPRLDGVHARRPAPGLAALVLHGHAPLADGVLARRHRLHRV